MSTAPLPGLRGSTIQALYPFTKTATYSTLVHTFENGAEQRSKRLGGCLFKFDLPYTKLSRTDKESLRTHIASAKGALSTNISLTLNNTYGDGTNITYSHLALEDESFDFSETKNLQWDVHLRLRQVIPQTITRTNMTAWPAFANGTVTQVPFVQSQRWQTRRNDQETGPRYAYGDFGTGQTGYPTRGLMGWTLSNPMLTDADALVVETAFHNCWGRWKQFNFTDPESGVTYPKVRWDSDSLEMRYSGVNQVAASVKLVEFF